MKILKEVAYISLMDKGMSKVKCEFQCRSPSSPTTYKDKKLPVLQGLLTRNNLIQFATISFFVCNHFLDTVYLQIVHLNKVVEGCCSKMKDLNNPNNIWNW